MFDTTNKKAIDLYFTLLLIAVLIAACVIEIKWALILIISVISLMIVVPIGLLIFHIIWNAYDPTHIPGSAKRMQEGLDESLRIDIEAYERYERECE